MPTRKRRLQEEELNKALGGQKPSVLFSLSDDLSHGVYRGITLTDEHGNVSKHPHTGGIKGERTKVRREDALDLQKKYRDIWGKRGAPKLIAYNENLSVSTVQKYFKDFPIKNN